MRGRMISSVMGTCVSVVITLVCIVFVAFLAYQFHISDQFTKISVTAIYIIACFLGGMFAGHRKDRKYMRGFGAGLGYLLLLCVCSFLKYNDLSFLNHSATYLASVLCLSSGTLGGMLA